MKILTIKQSLLVGTAIIAASAFTGQAQAADQLLTGAGTWASAATAGGTDVGDASDAAAGNNVDVDTFLLTITNDQTANDGSGLNTFILGDITDTNTAAAGTGGFDVVQDAAGNSPFTVIISSVDVADGFTINNANASNANTSVSITGDLSTDEAILVSNNELDAAKTVSLTVNGVLTASGSVYLYGGSFAGANTTLTVKDDADFSDALELNDDTGLATLVVAGTAAQAITGTIDGGGDDEGTVNVTNTTGLVTFADDIGSSHDLLAYNQATGTSAETDGELNAATVTLTGTASLVANDVINATDVVIGKNGSLEVAGVGATTAAVANSGTLLLSGTGGVDGAVTGTGTLDVNESATVTGAITQSSVTVATTKTLTADADITSPVVLEGAGATLALSTGGQTVTGNVTTTGATGTGAITIADNNSTYDIVGNIGTSDLHLATLAIAGNGGNNLTTNGNLFIDAITADDSDMIAFNGTSAQTVSGSITGGDLGLDDDTNVTFGVLTSIDNVTLGDGSIMTLGGVSGIDTIINGLDSVVNVNANTTLGGVYTNTGGTTNVGVGSVLSALALSDDGVYVLKANDADLTLTAADFGTLVDNGGGAVALTADNIRINVTGALEDGAGPIQLLTSLNTGAAVLADNSIQYTFTVADNAANTDVTVTKASAASLSTSSNAGIGATLDGLSTSTDTQIAAINDNLAMASSQEDFNEVLESVGPTVDGGGVVAGFSASVQSLDVSNTRLASLRDGSAQTGMTAGEMGNGVTAWTQGFGKVAEQDRRDGIDGYDADTYGLAVGIDSANVMNDATVGVAFSYANTDVDSKNANATETEVDSYQVSLYGDYDIDDQTYVTGTLAFAWNNNDQTRHNVGGVAGLTADSDFDSNQYIAYAEVGHDYAIANRTTLTPYALAHYQHIAIDDYTETGAGGANLDVDSNDLDIFELGLGAQVAWDLDGGNGSKIRPALNAGYRHDLVGDSVDTSSTLAGGGAAFSTQGLEPAQGTFDVGASISYAMDNNWEFTADYDYEVKSDYDSHAASLRAGYKF